MNTNNFSNCLLCNSTALRKLDRYSKDYLVKCTNCSFIFSQRIATHDELVKLYSTYPISESLSPITAKRYDEWLNEFEKFRSTNNILDVGCGDGYFLQRARAKGWNVYGTEFTPRQVDACNAKGINMQLGVLDIANYSPDFFDVITSVEVIEHINNPNEELKKFYQLCRKGGAVYVTTPNFDALSRYYLKNKWNIFAYPEHLCYYTKKSLSFVFERNGFRLHSFKSTGISIKRIKQSTSVPGAVSTNDDELLRQQAEQKSLFRIAKQLINSILTLTNKGDTLKGIFIKI